MKINTSVLIYSCHTESGEKIASRIPVVVYQGNNVETDARNVVRIVAKYLAKGDFSVISEKERLAQCNLDDVRLILTSGTNGRFSVEDVAFYIQPFMVECKEREAISEFGRRTIYVHYDDSKECYVDMSDKIGQIPSHLIDAVDIVTNRAYESPFIFESPFIYTNEHIYAVNRKTKETSGPYRKAEWFGLYYLVYTSDKGGIVAPEGNVVADCVYDSIYSEMGYAVYEIDGKYGLYSPWHDLLVKPVYDKVIIPEDDEACILVEKGLESGYLDTEGNFHPDVDIDLSLSYL